MVAMEELPKDATNEALNDIGRKTTLTSEAARKEAANKQFPVIEILALVFVIGLLSAIGLPNFIGTQNKAKSASVKGNMRTVQIALEANSVNGAYPIDSDEFRKFCKDSGWEFSSVRILPARNSEIIQQMKTDIGFKEWQTKNGFRLKPSQTYLLSVDSGSSYGIFGTTPDGNIITGTGGFPLVLSNQ
jgi:type II secretory pathway pseudopilin PulG